MLSNRIAPTMLADPSSVSKLARKVQEAEGEVRSGNSMVAEKQAVLDLIEEGTRVAESQKQRGPGAEQDEAERQGEEEDVGKIKRRATFNYFLGCLCLGAGAERLNARTKQKLISKVLALGSLVVNGWTQDRAYISATEIEKELKASVSHKRVVTELGDRLKTGELERFVRRLSEVIEITLLQEPSRYVIGVMAQYARHSVLGQSVQAVGPASLEDDYQRLLRGIWLTEVKTETGIRALRRAVRDAKPGNFLRVILVEHLLRGVRWDHWELSIRLRLIDLAYEIVRPTSLSFDKGRIERDVSNADD